MNCMACCKSVVESDALICSQCGHKYHYQCLNISTATYQRNSAAYKKSWHCDPCLNITTRKARGRGDNTPVRNVSEPLNVEKNGDKKVSHQQSLKKDIPASDSQKRPSNPQSGTITLQEFSDLFDTKIEQLRASLLSQINATISSEIKAAMDEIKKDFTATTDFLSEEQRDCKAEISEATKSINELESLNCQLQADIKSLERRLNAAEKHSRSLNLEVHAVPERRNENVVLIFKKLCEIIGYPIVDSDIRSCRRVAKMNTNSDRPRSILVTLPSERCRDDIISAVRKFNRNNPKEHISSTHVEVPGEKQLIYVGEHLPPSAKELHSVARRFAKDNHYKFVWVKFGKIYLRKDEKSPPLLIKDKCNLPKLS
ncbi:uncharacterized protein LOC125491396 [Plutella xylostella]|uniref:uncharacterized protein LOC125491396 n=1 Tax=Plutella xylostella TaxID=51655 RepID=UPI0020325A15|nr:uncharacterized protein LOC125491396 [Plutella xylostella]